MRKGAKVAVGAGVLASAGLATYLVLRKPAAPPPGLAALYGTVADAQTGAPLAGVLVSLNGETAITDADGYYEFTSVEPETYLLVFTIENYEVVEMTVTLSAGESRELSVALTPIYVPPALATLYGVVVDAETGAPLAGVLVSIDGYAGYTAANGRYEISDIPAGTYSVTFSKEGYEPLVL
ncbi:unnamed protein product [marine sediment metagenome]|uniref:PEGA domain-containing protein n=1 Tax=marine sediment metagenome TaxID=412755 RepID=X1LVI3_9ZZZZ